MHRLLQLSTLALLLSVSSACSGGAGEEEPMNTGVDAGVRVDATATADANTNVDADADIDADVPDNGDDGDMRTVYGVANADDDNNSDNPDWYEPPFANENDFSTMTLPNRPGHSVSLSLSGDADDVRIWNEAGQVVLGDNFDQALISNASVPADGSQLRVEFGWYLVQGFLDIQVRDESDAVVIASSVTLWSAPLILNHHLQPSEHVYVVSTPNGPSKNVAMIAGYKAVLSASEFTAVPDNQVGDDIWMQDEIEFSTSIGDEGQRMNTVVDSIRNRGLNAFAPSRFVGPEYYISTFGSGQANTYDSFGNLEVSPPVTVNGVSYPFGRAYYGDVGTEGPNGTVGAFLETQKIQAPFTVNTSWLCVGHVDEVSSWIPDPSSALGFKLLIADVPAALALIDSLPNNISLPYYNSHGFPTSNSIKYDTAFRNENLDIQDDYLTPIVNAFKANTGITDADIIRVPALFEDVGCGMAALMPGTVNLIVANDAAGSTHLFLPDPFFRNTMSQASDPFIAHFNSILPTATANTHFLDDWYSYHELLGEVHCGTNVERTPISNWWETAMHLVETN